LEKPCSLLAATATTCGPVVGEVGGTGEEAATMPLA
jgi:hypothetical protein